MKKTKRAYTVLGISFILFNVIAFAVPNAKTATFYIAYAFTVIAFALQIGTWNATFRANNTLKSKFLGIPIVYVGIMYLVFQLIAFAVFMVFPVISSWIAVVICALLLGIFAISLISADAASDRIKQVEENVNRKVFYIRQLQTDIEMLAEQEQNAETKMKLEKLAEKIRYSDPMSGDILMDLETRISEITVALKTADHKSEMIAELDLLLTERNKKVKLLK